MGLVWQGGNGVDDLLREQVNLLQTHENVHIVQPTLSPRLTRTSYEVDLVAATEGTRRPRSPPSIRTSAAPLLVTDWGLLHTGESSSRNRKPL